jgi:hypothetical protein
MDIRATIQPKSDQLNADDLIGGAKTIKIRDVKGAQDEAQPLSIYFDGDDNKPYKPCKSMRRVLVQLWGYESDDYKGRYLTLYRDDSVKFAGVEVGGIRISHASHIENDTRVLLTVSKSKRAPVTIQKLEIKKPQIKDFEGAKKAVAEGTVTIELLQSKYEISDEQIKKLESCKK